MTARPPEPGRPPEPDKLAPDKDSPPPAKDKPVPATKIVVHSPRRRGRVTETEIDPEAEAGPGIPETDDQAA